MLAVGLNHRVAAVRAFFEYLVMTAGPRRQPGAFATAWSGSGPAARAATWLREHQPATGVVVLSQYAAPGYAIELLEQGSAGRAYLLKERVASVDELAQAIRTVAAGGSVIDPAVIEELVRARTREKTPASRASPRGSRRSPPRWPQGKSNAAIAATLFVTERAVEKHINSIFAKLSKDVNRRVKAVFLGG